MNLISQLPTQYPNYLAQLNNIKDDLGKPVPGQHCLLVLDKYDNYKFSRNRRDIRDLLKFTRKPSCRKKLNYYMSINTCKFGKGRSSDNVLGLCGLWSDIDLKALPVQTTVDDMYHEMLPQIRQASGLPEPTAIDNSGHGIHLIWLFSYALVIHSIKIKKRWKVLEYCFNRRLNDGFRQVSGLDSNLTDPQVKDYSRVLRIPYTWNIKHMRPIRMCETLKYTGVHYNMISLCNKYIEEQDIVGALGIKQYKKHKYYHHHYNKSSKNRHYHSHHKHSKEYYKKLSKGQKFSLSYSFRSYLYTRRVRDLKILIKLRNNEDCDTGYREELLFVYSVCEYFLTMDVAKQNPKFKHKHNEKALVNYVNTRVIDDFCALNIRFNQPLDRSQLRNLAKETRKGLGKYYHLPNKYIIKYLKITLDEQKSLKMLLSAKEQRNRHNLSRNIKNQRRSHKSGAKSKRTKRISKVIHLHELGLSARKIANKLNLGNKTVSRYLKLL